MNGTRRSVCTNIVGTSPGNVTRDKTNPLYDSKESLDPSWYHTQTAISRLTKPTRPIAVTVIVILALICDLFVFFFVAALAYVFRCSNSSWFYKHNLIQENCKRIWAHIPYRLRRYSCSDSSLNMTSNVTDFDSFPLKAEISDDIICIFGFCVPVLIIVIGELFLWILMRNNEKSLLLPICPKIQIPHSIRRIFRFIGIYLFGAFSLIIIVGIIKILVGTQRPNFLLICNPVPCNITPSKRYPLSDPSRTQLYIDKCKETNVLIRKDISTSFPSMSSALTMYAAIMITMYLHGICKIHHSKYICIPCFCLIVICASVCTGLARYGRNFSWPVDIATGFALGFSMAIYVGCIILHNFKFQSTISNRKLHRLLGQSGFEEKGGATKEWFHGYTV